MRDNDSKNDNSKNALFLHNSTFIRTHAKLEVLGLSLNKLEEANKKERTPMLGSFQN